MASVTSTASSSMPFKDWPNDAGFDVDHEERKPVELTVTGSIPAYAAGTLYRNGPGRSSVDSAGGKKFLITHWFDGFTQVHRFQIKPSKDPKSPSQVFYNSRNTVDALIEDIRINGRYRGVTFGQKRDPCQTHFRKFMSLFEKAPRGDPSLTNVGVTISINPPGLTPVAEDNQQGIKTLWAKTDASILKQLDPETLEPIGIASQSKLHPSLNGSFSAAHAKSDPVTGDVYNYNLALGRSGLYRIFHVSASTGKTEVLASIPNAAPAYLHSLFLTANHVVLCVWNSYYGLGGTKILLEKNLVEAILPFDPSRKTTWYVVDRHHGRGLLATYESDPLFCFHTVNAWEETATSKPGETDIIAELVSYENNDVLRRFYYENMRSTSPAARTFIETKGSGILPHYTRFRLPALPASPNSTPLPASLVFSASAHSAPELPTLNSAFATKPHRYTYGIVDRGLSSWVDGVVKFDSSDQSAVYWSEKNHTPGEAIFVADPNGAAEDDGVLLTVVLDGTKGTSYLLCLDAHNLVELGRAEMSWPVALSFHGTHYPLVNGGAGFDF
ncbi:MAG: hypothetical protein M1829_001357 [Trizodia sp. TS-e1964]|nr:MAG: hypothetical protein M1829_001357 [Trizodia sp. TS-e1964]